MIIIDGHAYHIHDNALIFDYKLYDIRLKWEPECKNTRVSCTTEAF